LKPFDVFICYKKSSGKDFAEHLKSGLEELGLHSFIDSKDIPQMVDGKEEWAKIRDRAIEESKTFIFIITPGVDKSSEVIKELSTARKIGNKEFIYFRHRNLGRKIVIDLEDEKVDFGKQQQVSFETKEELLRLAHNILFKGQISGVSLHNLQLAPSKSVVSISPNSEGRSIPEDNRELKCIMCSKPVHGKAHVVVIDNKSYNFDSIECALTYRKLKKLYGRHFE